MKNQQKNSNIYSSIIRDIVGLSICNLKKVMNQLFITVVKEYIPYCLLIHSLCEQ